MTKVKLMSAPKVGETVVVQFIEETENYLIVKNAAGISMRMPIMKEVLRALDMTDEPNPIFEIQKTESGIDIYLCDTWQGSAEV